MRTGCLILSRGRDPTAAVDRDEPHDIYRFLRGVADEYVARCLVGEVGCRMSERFARYLRP